MNQITVNRSHTTNVKELAIDGTVVTSTAAELNILDTVTSTAAELNILDGVESTASELDQFTLIGTIDDISTSGSYWVTCPYAATIEKIYTVINGAISGGDAAITFEIANVAVTGGAITIANASSAAGDVDNSTPSGANVLTAGQPIELITNGGSTNTVIGVVTFVMQRT